MKPIALAVLALTVSSANAQFGSAGAPPTMPGWAHGGGSVARPASGGRGFPGSRSSVILLGEPWAEGYVPQSGQTTYIVLPPQAQAAPKPVEEVKPIMPLLIERRGDRFVRTQGDVNSDLTAASTLSADAPFHPAAPRPADRVPVTLVYRDGHREQVRDYSIISGHLYTSTDYVQSGTWMKSISLATLDLPATVEANRDTGGRFVLPTAPNIVITRF